MNEEQTKSLSELLIAPGFLQKWLDERFETVS